MSLLGLIGGSGAAGIVPAGHRRLPQEGTPFGKPSGPLLQWQSSAGQEILFLERHGPEAALPPHRVNYRANIWLLAQHGVAGIVGLNAVGGIGDEACVGCLVIPDQLIDYTAGREHSYAGEAGFGRLHVDFTEPFDPALRRLLCERARSLGLAHVAAGTYAATQGPRLETAAEIDRLAQDGCTIVGMTGMPEAALARELALPYAICALVLNRAAGRGPGGSVLADIEHHLRATVAQAARLIDGLRLDARGGP